MIDGGPEKMVNEESNNELWTCPGWCLPLTSLSAGTGCRMDGLGVAVMMVLRVSFLIASDQSNFKVGEKKHSKINIPCNDGDRELQVGASAKARAEAALDFSHTR